MKLFWAFWLLMFTGCCCSYDPSWDEFVKITEESNLAFAKAGEVGKTLADKYGLIYLNTGVGSIIDSKVTAYDFSLMSYQGWTIEQARQIVPAFIQEAYVHISKVPSVHADMHNRMVGEHFHVFDPVFSPKRLGLKLNFWNANMDRPNPPYLSRVMVKDGFVYYYYAKSDQSLDEPVVDPL